MAVSIVESDYTLKVGGYRFGFVDIETTGLLDVEAPATSYTTVEVGPVGTYPVPVTARSGWVLVAILSLLAVGLIAALTRRKKSS